MNCILLSEKLLLSYAPVAQIDSFKKRARSSYTFFLVACILLLPTLLFAQLRELEITPDATPATIPVFTDYPENAAVIINSSIPNLQFSSTLDIVRDLSQPGSGRYVIIIPAARQSIQVSANGFITQSFSVGNISAREVRYFRVEPKNVNITETGTLILRTNPAGASVSIDGVPGTFTTPHTFPELLAQRYTVRISLKDHEDEVVQVDITPERPLVRDIFLKPFFGNLIVGGNANQLWVRKSDEDEELRISLQENTPVRLAPGDYIYRLARPFHQDVRWVFSVELGGVTQISGQLVPEFSTLRVSTNVNNFRLYSTDNQAPSSDVSNIIYLERGVRSVDISAPGYETLSLSIRSVSGGQIDTSVTLISSAEIEQRRFRESLPAGILSISADVDAQIFINGEYRGERAVTLTIVPDQYKVELRHPVRNRSFTVDVPSAELISIQETMLPSRGRALFLSGVLPGTGHIYTNRARGYLYLGSTIGVGVFMYLMHGEFRESERLHERNYALYINAQTVEQAGTYRVQAERHFESKTQAFDLMLIGASAAAGLYVLQFLDIALTKPTYGYRRKAEESRLSASLTGTGFTLSYSIH